MKSILFIRHAKSSWDDPAMNDFDRPLNERGKRDAPQMAKYLHEHKIPIDTFISSPAKRAKKTASYFVKEYGFEEDCIIFKSELYLPEENVFFDVVESAPDDAVHLAVFSHNPGISNFVNVLTDKIRVNDLPTCGIFGIKTNITHWKDFQKAPKEFWFFDYPGNH
ncbi:MAG: histidine phosphatase family protein [Agriterribacter sp.]